MIIRCSFQNVKEWGKPAGNAKAGAQSLRFVKKNVENSRKLLYNQSSLNASVIPFLDSIITGLTVI